MLGESKGLSLILDLYLAVQHLLQATGLQEAQLEARTGIHGGSSKARAGAAGMGGHMLR